MASYDSENIIYVTPERTGVKGNSKDAKFQVLNEMIQKLKHYKLDDNKGRELGKKAKRMTYLVDVN